MLEIGTKAPDFILPDQNGDMHTLEEYRGKKVVLYFYPRDNTPGCSKQACGFGELYPQFTEKGAVVLGVSKDSVASIKNSRKNTICRLHFFLTQSLPASRHMMCGKKRICTAKKPWASYVPPTLLMKKV